MKTAIVIALLLLLGCLSVPAFSQPGTAGDWVTENDPTGHGFTFAGTINQDGHALTEYCYVGKGCEWRLGSATECKPGAEGVALVNGDTIFTATPIVCLGKMGDLWMYKVMDWRNLEDVITKSQKIAVVLPIGGAQFRVYRFSTSGAVQATASIGGPITGERHDANERRQTRDTTI